MPANSLSDAAVLRITLDLLADEVARSRRRSTVALGRPGWNASTRVDAGGLDLDSLERLDVAAALNEFFHLHEYGAEDYLLALSGIGEWCELIAQSLPDTGARLTFRTSGSTGKPKRCTHNLADLATEARGWVAHFGAAVPDIVSLVPSHHIFGTMFTALLPDAIGPQCPVVEGAGAEAVRGAASGTLVIATPTQWAYLARSLLVFPDGLIGITSTAPMPSELAHQLRAQRLSRLVEIYGSSETGGVALREREQTAFTLLDNWTLGESGEIERVLADGSRSVAALPDRLRWLSDRQFALEGRLDGAVQIGGTNVFLGRVRDLLLAHAGVAEAAVRLETDTGRLKAFIVPAATNTDPDRLAGELDQWCGQGLTAVERPRRFTVGGALPVNAMGKPSDW